MKKLLKSLLLSSCIFNISNAVLPEQETNPKPTFTNEVTQEIQPDVCDFKGAISIMRDLPTEVAARIANFLVPEIKPVDHNIEISKMWQMINDNKFDIRKIYKRDEVIIDSYTPLSLGQFYKRVTTHYSHICKIIKMLTTLQNLLNKKGVSNNIELPADLIELIETYMNQDPRKSIYGSYIKNDEKIKSYINSRILGLYLLKQESRILEIQKLLGKVYDPKNALPFWVNYQLSYYQHFQESFSKAINYYQSNYSLNSNIHYTILSMLYNGRTYKDGEDKPTYEAKTEHEINTIKYLRELHEKLNQYNRVSSYKFLIPSTEDINQDPLKLREFSIMLHQLEADITNNPSVVQYITSLTLLPISATNSTPQISEAWKNITSKLPNLKHLQIAACGHLSPNYDITTTFLESSQITDLEVCLPTGYFISKIRENDTLKKLSIKSNALCDSDYKPHLEQLLRCFLDGTRWITDQNDNMAMITTPANKSITTLEIIGDFANANPFIFPDTLLEVLLHNTTLKTIILSHIANPNNYTLQYILNHININIESKLEKFTISFTQEFNTTPTINNSLWDLSLIPGSTEGSYIGYELTKVSN